MRQVEILSGVSRSTISEIENEKNFPKMDTMEQLAKGLKVHITDLFESEWK